MSGSENYSLEARQVLYPSTPQSPPRIVCAACSFYTTRGYVVIPSARHFDRRMHEVLRVFSMTGRREEEQGFIDQHGNFYTRHVAWEIAEANGQIVKRVGGDGPAGAGLFSENLY